MNEVTQLISGNPIYQQNYARWLYLYHSYIGGDTYRNGNYLTKYQLETDNEYQARLNNAFLDNQCQGIISLYNSFLFREDPIREFGSIANLLELEDFVKDVDFEGRSLNNFMREVSIWSKVFGHSWIIMSKANINAVTRADEQAVMLRPYVSVITPLTMLDWDFDRDVTGRYELSLIRYVEEINGSVQTIKTWTKDTISTHTVDTSTKVITNVIEEDNQLGIIPAIIAYNNRSIVRGIGVSAITDIADCQRFIYNCTSEVDQSIRLDSHPSLVKTEDTMSGVGAGAIIQIPQDLDPGLKPYVLDFTGANIPNIYTAIKNTIESIEKMASTGAVRGTQSSSMSGVALETEFQILNAKLAEQADNMELAEEQMWKLWCMYQSQPYDMTISYPDTFSIRDSGREIAELKIAADTNPTDARTKAAIDMKVLDFLELDEDELTAIQDTSIIDLSSINESEIE